MGIGRKRGPGGGGASLNFDVKAYPSEEELLAAVPKENTIGIITTVPIPSWSFRDAQPETPVEGMVWFPTGTNGEIELNALKKNEVALKPLSAKQYVSGAWKNVDAQNYTGGQWLQFSNAWNGELYETNNEHTDITGGWSNSGWSTPYSGFSANAPTIDETGITLKSTSEKQFPCAGTANKIDLSNYSTLYVTVDSVTSGMNVFLAVNSEKKVWNDSDYPMTARKSISAAGEIALSVKNVSSAYVVVFAYSGSGTKSAKISKIWME